MARKGNNKFERSCLRNHDHLPGLAGNSLVGHSLRTYSRKGSRSWQQSHILIVKINSKSSAEHLNLFHLCTRLIVDVDHKFGHHVLEDHRHGVLRREDSLLCSHHEVCRCDACRLILLLNV